VASLLQFPPQCPVDSWLGKAAEQPLATVHVFHT
jgi:hypothetical protein